MNGLIKKYSSMIFVVIFWALIIGGVWYWLNMESKKQDEQAYQNLKNSPSIIKPECAAEANSLYSVCTASNVSTLSIELLAKCDRLTSDKSYFLAACEEDELFLFVDMDYASSSPSKETVFGKKLIDICENTKFSDLTIKEINICKDFSSDFNILNCDYNQ